MEPRRAVRIWARTPTSELDVQQGRHQKSSLFLVHRIGLRPLTINSHNESNVMT